MPEPKEKNQFISLTAIRIIFERIFGDFREHLSYNKNNDISMVLFDEAIGIDDFEINGISLKSIMAIDSITIKIYEELNLLGISGRTKNQLMTTEIFFALSGISALSITKKAYPSTNNGHEGDKDE